MGSNSGTVLPVAVGVALSPMVIVTVALVLDLLEKRRARPLRPRSLRGGPGRGPVVTAGAALMVIVAVTGCSRQEQAGPQSVSDVDSVLLAGGLVVCASRPAPAPPGATAMETQALDVGSTDAGELSAEGQNSGGSDSCAPEAVTQVTVTRYPDQDARDAGAQSLQGAVAPGDGTTLYTTGDLTILVRSTSIDAPTDRVNEVLSAATSP